MLSMQWDGNLVMYNASGAWKWQTYTSGKPPHGSCSQGSSEATYVMFDTVATSSNPIRTITNSSIVDCANACVQDRANYCVSFRYTSAGVCTLQKDDVGDAYYYGSGDFAGYIRGRRAQGQ